MGKLLIVDDDEALRRLMRIELSGTFEIIDSGEPEQGLALALEHRPEAILLDLRMPKYSGYELLQTFTSFSCTQMIPVIVIIGEEAARPKNAARSSAQRPTSRSPLTLTRCGHASGKSSSRARVSHAARCG